jgi:PilZ domain-containing protein
MQERRTAERIRLDLTTRWEGLTTQGRGAVSDLSSTGCFVLSGGEVTTGELIRLQISFPGDVEIVWGRVVYAVAEIGFALRFVFGDKDDKRALERLIGTVS